MDSKLDHLSASHDGTNAKLDDLSVQVQKLYDDMNKRINQLDLDLKCLLSKGHLGPEFTERERHEPAKEQVCQIERDIKNSELSQGNYGASLSFPTIPP